VLVPAREAVVAENQKRYNFMLIGAFELLQAKQAEYDAYQGYLDAMRDYWIARSALKLAVGGELPSSAAALPAATIGIPKVPTAANGSKGMDHSLMGKEAEPLKTTPAAGSTVYVCPMHSEVTSDKPGVCPICGMDLQLEESAKSEHSEHDHSGENK